MRAAPALRPALPALQMVEASCSDGLPLWRHDALQPLVQWMRVEASCQWQLLDLSCVL